jgi:hypothetical protein
MNNHSPTINDPCEQTKHSEVVVHSEKKKAQGKNIKHQQWNDNVNKHTLDKRRTTISLYCYFLSHSFPLNPRILLLRLVCTFRIFARGLLLLLLW